MESRHDALFHMHMQVHPFHEVFLLLAGSVEVRLRPTEGDAQGDLTRVLEPGSYIAVPAGVHHALYDRRQATVVVVACSEAALDATPGRRATWDAITHRATAAFPVLSAAPLRHHAAPWRDLIASNRFGADRLELETAFSRFLVELRRLAVRPAAPDARERVRDVARRLPRLIHEEWSLDRAAGEAVLSRRRFSAVWREVTGTSFIASLHAERIAAAQRLMRDAEHSIVGAAFAVGFNDIANFYRVFRRIVGCAPGEWLATVIEEAVPKNN